MALSKSTTGMNASRHKDEGSTIKAAPAKAKAIEEDKEQVQPQPFKQSIMLQLLKDALLRKIHA